MEPCSAWDVHLKALHGAVLFWKLDPDPRWSEKLYLELFYMLKMERWRFVDAHNGGMEAQNRALEGL
jgi:hypothetical protein